MNQPTATGQAVNPRLAALDAADDAWVETECTDWYCPCTFPEGEMFRFSDDDLEVEYTDDPTDMCDCSCHRDHLDALAALTDADRAERRAQMEAGRRRIQAAFKASGAATFGELVKAYPNGLPPLSGDAN